MNYRQEVLLKAVKIKDTLISILRCLRLAGKNKGKFSRLKKFGNNVFSACILLDFS